MNQFKPSAHHPNDLYKPSSSRDKLDVKDVKVKQKVDIPTKHYFQIKFSKLGQSHHTVLLCVCLCIVYHFLMHNFKSIEIACFCIF